MINELPTIFEVVTGAAKKQVKEKSSVSNHSGSKSKSSSKAVIISSHTCAWHINIFINFQTFVFLTCINDLFEFWTHNYHSHSYKKWGDEKGVKVSELWACYHDFVIVVLNSNINFRNFIAWIFGCGSGTTLMFSKSVEVMI